MKLWEAVRDGKVAELEAMLKAGTSFADRNLACLWAIGIRRPDIVRMLVRAGANPESDGGYMLAACGSDIAKAAKGE